MNSEDSSIKKTLEGAKGFKETQSYIISINVIGPTTDTRSNKLFMH